MQRKKKLQCLPVYKRLNNRFLSCHGWPSHPIMGSGSFAYFLMSLQRTAFIDPKDCPWASNSTCFFMAVLPPPFRVGSGCEVSTASLLFFPESSSESECVAYPRLQQSHSTLKQTLGAHKCWFPRRGWSHKYMIWKNSCPNSCPLHMISVALMDWSE